ncbi:hypothetical protein AB5I41_11900 [Sphingomonas sp. MMS24-JH45]
MRHRGLALGFATSGLSADDAHDAADHRCRDHAAGGWRAGYWVLAATTSVAGASAGAVAAARRAADPDRARTRRRAGRQGGRRGDGAGGAAGAALLAARARGRAGQRGQRRARDAAGPLGRERGLGAGEAALLLTSYGASQVAGRLVIGALVDRFVAQRVAAVVALVSAVAFAALLAPAPGFALMMLLVFFAGLMNGAEHDLLPFLTARLFGLRAYREVYREPAAGIAGGHGWGYRRVRPHLRRLRPLRTGADAAAAIALVLAGLAFATLPDRALPEAQARAAPARPLA